MSSVIQFRSYFTTVYGQVMGEQQRIFADDNLTSLQLNLSEVTWADPLASSSKL